jgi:HK97 family phage portal protein
MSRFGDFMKRIFGEKEERTLEDVASLMRRGALSSYSSTGVSVTSETALQASAVFACVRVLSESEAMLPLVLYRQNGKNREKAVDHPLYRLLHDAPNQEMTSFNFRQTIMSHLCLRGNAYVYIEYGRDGKISALYPLNPDGVQIVREKETGILLYGVQVPEKYGGEYLFLTSERVWHLRGMGSDGVVGYNPIRLAREAIGLSIAAEGYGASFFGNNAEPGFVLVHPGKLNDEAYKRLRQSWEDRHKGFENAHKVAILEEGMRPEKLGVSPEDAQFLETRKFQINEIARIFRVPPHMIADLDRATFSNIEHMGLEFVMYSLMPWLVNIEQSVNANLLSPAERGKYYAKHTLSGLLRGDVESRYRAYATARQWGFMSVDEIRELEELNPLPEGQGQVYLTPLNMMPTGTPTGQDRQTHPDAEYRVIKPYEMREVFFQRRRALMEKYQGLFLDSLERIYRRERNDVMRLAEKHLRKRELVDFNLALAEYYLKHAEIIRQYVGKLMETYAELVGMDAVAEADKADAYDSELVRRFIRSYVDAFASREAYESKQRVDNAVKTAVANGDDPYEAVNNETEGWITSRAQGNAHDEAVRINGAVSATVWKAVGVSFLVWRTYGEKTCPYCQSMDGKRIAIDGWFLAEGDSIIADGGEKLVAKQNHRHPPLHGGCDCMIGVG